MVDGLSLRVPAGSVFGFLGPNGSGKTTTIRLLLGLISPASGSWRLLDQAMPNAADRVLPRVGALIEGPAFYPWLTGRQNLARLDATGRDGQPATRTRRIGDALSRVGLSAAANKKYKAYSLGMRQRLGLASSLLRPRDLLILDEPTNGMDPQGTREIRHLIHDLAREGTTVFLSTHLLAEVEQICTHVGVMSLGHLVMQGPLEEMRAVGSVELRVETDDLSTTADVLDRIGLSGVKVQGSLVTAALDGRRPEDCCRALVEAGIGVRSLTTSRPSLEDSFVALTGEGFDVAR